MEEITFGKRLRNRRIEKGLKQRDIATSINCAPTSLTNYEKGIINPPIDVLSKICNVLEISALDLLGKRYTFNDILEILSKPANERDYEEQVAINFSYSILKKQKSNELKRLEKERENQNYISKETGLSLASIEALKIEDTLICNQDKNKITPAGIEALNKLLSCPEGLQILENIAIYLRAGDFHFENGEKPIKVNVGEFSSNGVNVNKSLYLTPDMIKSIVRDEFLKLLDIIKARIPQKEIEKSKENFYVDVKKKKGGK